MPAKKDKKIAKKLVKKPVKKVVKQKQTQRQSVNQKQNVIVNVHTGKSASQGKSKSKASGSSKVERVVPMPNYQASESPYPSYMRQSVAVPVMQEPVQAGNPAFASVGQTVGPIPNRIPVFPDAPQQPIDMEEETFIRPPLNRNRIPKPKTKTEQPTMIPDEEETFIRTPMPEESPSEVMLRIGREPLTQPIYQPIYQPTIRTGKKIKVTLPKLPSETLTRKAPAGSRRDLKDRYYNLTGNTWQDVSKRKEKTNTDELRTIVKDLEAGVAR